MAPQAAKYLVYKLPAESVLVGIECSFHSSSQSVANCSVLGVICLEEFAKGKVVLQKSRFCPNTVFSRFIGGSPQLFV
jgi:hypothetical protein